MPPPPTDKSITLTAMELREKTQARQLRSDAGSTQTTQEIHSARSHHRNEITRPSPAPSSGTHRRDVTQDTFRGDGRRERSTRTWRSRVATRWPAAERVGDLREAGMTGRLT